MQAKANFDNRRAQAKRRLELTSIAVSQEEQESFVAQAQMAEGAYNQDISNLAQARANLARTRIVSPVNGYVTNLTAQVGDDALSGQRALTIVDADSFWLEGYFEETLLNQIHIGDAATISLMSGREKVSGHVSGISHGIEVSNAQTDPAGLASVNPIFTWIRLAQRVPVRIAIDHVPSEVTLVVGLTATVEVGLNSPSWRVDITIGVASPRGSCTNPLRRRMLEDMVMRGLPPRFRPTGVLIDRLVCSPSPAGGTLQVTHRPHHCAGFPKSR